MALTSVAALQRLLLERAPRAAALLRVVDCSGEARWARAHVPSAAPLLLDPALKDPRQPNAPLPPAAFEALAAALGAARSSRVVFYDAAGGVASARAWWLCRLYGLEGASVLDGGWQAWERAGAPVSSAPGDRDAPPVPAEEAVVARAQPQRLALLQEVVDAARSGAAGAREVQLVDARCAAEFSGDDRRGNRFGGRVPGAVCVPHTSLQAPDGTLLPVAALQERFHAAGLRPGVRTIAYCQMGVRAAAAALALEQAGFADVAVYDGSMREYLNSPGLDGAGLPRASGAA